MKHTYTEEQKEQIAQALYDFLKEHNVCGGNYITQNDSPQIYGIDLLAELADIKDVTNE